MEQIRININSWIEDLRPNSNFYIGRFVDYDLYQKINLLIWEEIDRIVHFPFVFDFDLERFSITPRQLESAYDKCKH